MFACSQVIGVLEILGRGARPRIVDVCPCRVIDEQPDNRSPDTDDRLAGRHVCCQLTCRRLRRS